MHSKNPDQQRGGSEGGGPRRRSRRTRQRKERVLHTRISEGLAEDIRDMAEDLRIPVSNLVRNVLEEAFAVVESVTDNVGDLVEEVVEEAERARERLVRRSERRRRRRAPQEPEAGSGRSEADDEPPAAPRFPDVIGWQPLILNRERSCEGCGDTLPAGDQAWVGIGETGLSPHTLCAGCLDALR